MRAASAANANAFPKEIAACAIALKDCRTLCATAAERLENTPAICRKSYVHPAVLTAFESGALREFAERLGRARSDAPARAAVGALLEAAAAA